MTKAAWGFPVVLIGVTVLLLGGAFAAFRLPLRYSLPQTEQPLGFYTDGVSNVEQDPNEPVPEFRWLNAYSEMRFPPLGRAAYTLDLVIHNVDDGQARTLELRGDDRLISHIALRPGWQALEVALPADAATPKLVMIANPPLSSGTRVLGVALGALTLRQVGSATMPLAVLLQLLLVWGLTIALGVVCAVSLRRSLLLATGLLGVLLVLLIGWRFATLLALPPLLQGLSWALPVGLVLRAVSWRWASGDERSWLAGVRFMAVGLFVVRVWGLWHPQFRDVDHLLRTHQIQGIALGQEGEVAKVLANQFEWGKEVQVPYSLWAYYPFVPLASLPAHQLKAVVEGVTAALDASICLLLYRIVVCAGSGAQQGWWTAATYAVLPIGFLFHHDGSFPTMIGLWMVVLTVLALQRLTAAPGWRWALVCTVGVTLSVLLYVTHLLFVPLLIGIYVASLWLLGKGENRSSIWWSAAALLGGVVLAIIIFYGRALPVVIRETIPSLWRTLTTEGSIGREASDLPTGLLGPFPMQVWGHFRVVGLVLAGFGLVWELRRRSWLRYLALAYGVFMLATALADTQFGMWNKHWYFALPGVAILAGSALYHLREQRLGRWAAYGILVALLVASLDAWFLRVIWYQATLRTL